MARPSLNVCLHERQPHGLIRMMAAIAETGSSGYFAAGDAVLSPGPPGARRLGQTHGRHRVSRVTDRYDDARKNLRGKAARLAASLL